MSKRSGGPGSLERPAIGSPGTEINAAPTLGSDVNVVITADNACGFGYGTDTTMVNYFGGVENLTSSDIFNCPVGQGAEAYTVPARDANAGGYLYIIGYADRATTQGVLAKFFRTGASPVFSGAGPWQACATGEDSDPGSKGPTLERINAQIANCNTGNSDPATTSAGWVTTAPSAHGMVAVGESNSTTRNRPSQASGSSEDGCPMLSNTVTGSDATQRRGYRGVNAALRQSWSTVEPRGRWSADTHGPRPADR